MRQWPALAVLCWTVSVARADDPPPDDMAATAQGAADAAARPAQRGGYGAQLGVWVPGKDAPSIAASATSVDARALVSYDTGFASVTANAGVRYDNSANSVDRPQDLSVEDRVSLGVSAYSAALVGASLRVP